MCIRDSLVSIPDLLIIDQGSDSIGASQVGAFDIGTTGGACLSVSPTGETALLGSESAKNTAKGISSAVDLLKFDMSTTKPVYLGGVSFGKRAAIIETDWTAKRAQVVTKGKTASVYDSTIWDVDVSSTRKIVGATILDVEVQAVKITPTATLIATGNVVIAPTGAMSTRTTATTYSIPPMSFGVIGKETLSAVSDWQLYN